MNFRGERRTNETHASTTDPDARLFRKSLGTGAVLCFMGHALMENRNGLVVDAELTRATGTAERLAALAMLEGVARETGRRVTIGADKGYDTADFVMEVRELNAVPHVARDTPPAGARPSTAAPPVTQAMPQASASDNASRRSSAGRRAQPATARPGSEPSPASASPSPSPPQPTT